MSVSRNKTVRILLLGWLFVIANSLSHTIYAQDVAPKVDEYMNAAMRTYHFSGTVLLARDGRAVVSRSYGVQNRPILLLLVSSLVCWFLWKRFNRARHNNHAANKALQLTAR